MYARCGTTPALLFPVLLLPGKLIYLVFFLFQTGPFFSIIMRDGERPRSGGDDWERDKSVLGVLTGFTAPPLGLLHLDTMRVRGLLAKSIACSCRGIQAVGCGCRCSTRG